MEKGNCGDVEVAHICSKTCNVLACNQQVRGACLLFNVPTPQPRSQGSLLPVGRVGEYPGNEVAHTLNLMLVYVWSRDSKKV